LSNDGEQNGNAEDLVAEEAHLVDQLFLGAGAQRVKHVEKDKTETIING
jgi:hypothetical protein